MNILERMHFIWPAAWRANQLLQGAKVLPQNHSAAILKVATPERHKRVAETLDEDSNGQASMGSEVYRQPQAYSQGSSSQSQTAFPLQLDLQSTEAPTFYQSYPTRWSSDNALPTLTSGLSTSVLPQPQYSTGLVDERVQRNPDRPSRYPQYWSDYSAMGQMDTAYDMPVIGEMVAQQPAQTDQQMYAQDQYSLYSEHAG